MKKNRMVALASAAAIMATMITHVPISYAQTTELYVGEDKTYTTINDAVEAAKEINPTSEDNRVIINVDPGEYEEQIIVDKMQYVTLQQTPETEGKVDLHWYYCTGYCTSDADLNGKYNPNIDWSADSTWEGDEGTFTRYEVGQPLTGVSTISYYDKNGTVHKDVPVKTSHLGSGTGLDKMAPLVVTKDSSNITVKDFNIVNSVPVMVTAGEKAAHLTPELDRVTGVATSFDLPRRDALSICDENTVPVAPTDVLNTRGEVDKQKYKELVEKGRIFTPAESAYLVRSSAFNERGHAIAIHGDKITLENVRARGNQDSVYITNGRIYFKNCDLIGGTDYIYGNATAVFDSCKLGAEGMTDKDYGATITAANTDATNPYGYLFYNCELYNVLGNITNSLYGRPWGSAAQITFYKTCIDDNATLGESKAGIDALGWRDMSAAKKEEARFFEYGTYNKSGAALDLSKRVKNTTAGMGSVLDDWQILEFNPRNYFAARKIASNKVYADDWDPMNFGEEYLADVDSEIAKSEITVPQGEETTITLPKSSNSNIEFHWVSASTNAVVSEDETTIEVIRPAVGEEPIETSVILYARDKTTGMGDKREIPVSIAATTDTTNVFDIPVTINQSTTGENTYTFTISKNGALIKQEEINVNDMQTIARIENIPASLKGIDYDVKIVSKSDDFTVIEPENGITTIKGITGTDAPLTITSNKLVDETIDINTTADAADGDKLLDLIALAKANGAKDTVETSDSIVVSFDLAVKAKLSKTGYIDITSSAPTTSVKTGADANRFSLLRINSSWNQLDSVDNTQGLSGSSNSEHQWLNVSGNFDYSTVNKIKAEINYKAKTITLSGEGAKSGSFTFTTFPETAQKGSLYMGIYPGSTADNYTVSNVKVTYKKLVTGTEPTPKPLPAGEGIYEFPGNNTSVAGGNLCSNEAVMRFTNDANTEAIPYFADTEDNTKIDPTLVANYKNYIAGTGNDTHPSITLNADAGTYRLYYLGHNSGKTPMTATTNGKTFTATAGTNFAYDESNTSKVLKLYTMDIELANKGDVVTFNTTDQWLPDLYTIVAVGLKAFATPTPIPTTAPTTEPTAIPTAAPTTEPTAIPTTAPTLTPDLTPRVISAYKSNGNTTVQLANISSGIVVGAKYTDGVLKKIKSAQINGENITIEGIEADKVFVWDSMEGMKPLCESADVSNTAPTPTTEVTTAPTSAPTSEPSSEINVDFTKLTSVPVYSSKTGQGFVSKSSSIMPDGYTREVAPVDKLTVSADGVKVTESTGSYLHYDSNEDFNYGGLIYRVDTGASGAYRLEVEVDGTSADTRVAPTGMDASRLTGGSTWDNPGNVPRKNYASWTGSTWSYDYATGENFIEFEIEPTALATAASPKTVGIKSIKITPLAVNENDDKPTIHILGDSTQKTYTFNETISAWGQTLRNYFDLSKVNVVNYSMGGRSMKSNYIEGRTNEVLVNGKAGDFVFIHSAHNDESGAMTRFVRGTNFGTLEQSNKLYNRWLDMYVEAIKARGMTPVLVSAMPRTGSGVPSAETSEKPNGFKPDSPGNMRAKAASDPQVGYVELYAGAKDYLNSINSKEGMYIYNNTEAGETPANNAANGAGSDGTHYKEAASKQWSRIMLQSMYDQSIAASDTYTDKSIMQELVSYMPQSVKNAAESRDWSEVFPEMASDVSAVGVIPNAQKQEESNFYYRNNIEKALQLGVLHKNADNLFKPNDTITVGEFARGIEKAFGLEENSLTSYTKTYDELNSSKLMAALDVEFYDYQDGTELYAGDGQYTVSITQPEGGTVTVYNESAFHTATTNIGTGIVADSVIDNNDYYTLTAPNEIVEKSDKNGVFTNNEITTDAIEIRNNGTKQPTYVAKESGILTLYVMFVDHKGITCENLTDNTESIKYINNTSTAGETKANQYNAVTFEVTAGKTYQFYTNGGTGRLFGIMYSSTDYPQDTSSLVVNENDIVRVVAVADENYLNDAIIIDGEKKAYTKEYTFTVTKDTAVTASFTAEPALVETTIIASDAALTREAMGAILYDAYSLRMGKGEDGKWNKFDYMNQNGGVPSPDDPNYDPNIQYEGSPYTPLTGWGALTDTAQLDNALYKKVKEVYNLGLMRSETGIARGSIANGTELEPKAEVTRAKAAKTLVFSFILTQKLNGESQELPDGINHASETKEIAVPNAQAPSTPIK